MSGKAGVGKSTVASNLAAAFARDQYAAAVLDFSLQFGDQGLMFDAPPSPSIVDVLANRDVLTPDFVLDCMHRGPLEIRVLTAPPSPELAELVLPQHVRDLVELIQPIFDVIVLDTDSYLGDVTLEVVDVADKIVLVTSPHLASVKNTKLLLKTLGDLGVPASKLVAVLNRVEPGVRMSLEVLEANLRFPLSFELANVPGLLVDSVTDGIPLVMSKPAHEWSQRMDEIAASLLGGTQAEGRKKKSFLGMR